MRKLDSKHKCSDSELRKEFKSDARPEYTIDTVGSFMTVKEFIIIITVGLIVGYLLMLEVI